MARLGCKERFQLTPHGKRVQCLAVFICSALVVGVASDTADGSTLMRQGMEAFSKGRVTESIKLFDDAAKAGYPRNMLWQRGLSLFYAGRFEEGAEQFRSDVALNPNDTEESIWAMLCEVQLVGFQEARRNMLLVGRDSRDVMRSVYSLFRGENEDKSFTSLTDLVDNDEDVGNQFYAALYLGLYAEALGNISEAKRLLSVAAASRYAKSSGDYMADLAKVHVAIRGWPTEFLTKASSEL